jgi:hypothetical protein
VAAALAQQAFGTRAAAVAGIYGALMLVAGAGAVTILRRQAEPDPAGAETRPAARRRR